MTAPDDTPGAADSPTAIPDVVRRRVATLGADGRAWLAALPSTLAELENAWAIRITEALEGGTASYVAAATTPAGREVVVKVAPPGLDLTQQAATLRRANGRGYARLLGYQPAHNACLLEGIGPSLQELDYPPEDQLRILCATLQLAWRPPQQCGMPTLGADAEDRGGDSGEDKATALGRMVGELWNEHGRPCSERVMTTALAYADRRAAAFDPARAVVVHGDPHPSNALRRRAVWHGRPAIADGPHTEPPPDATPTHRGPPTHRGSPIDEDTGFAFVDPDGFVADPAYDLGVVLRDWAPQLLAAENTDGPGTALRLAERYCLMLAEQSGLATQAIWEWGYLERVSTGLYTRAVGLAELGGAYLRTAELLV